MTEPETVQEALALADEQIKAANEMSAAVDAHWGDMPVSIERKPDLDVVLDLTSQLAAANERIAALEEILGNIRIQLDALLNYIPK